jgi:hypothetical protein
MMDHDRLSDGHISTNQKHCPAGPVLQTQNKNKKKAGILFVPTRPDDLVMRMIAT